MKFDVKMKKELERSVVLQARKTVSSEKFEVTSM